MSGRNLMLLRAKWFGKVNEAILKLRSVSTIECEKVTAGMNDDDYEMWEMTPGLFYEENFAGDLLRNKRSRGLNSLQNSMKIVLKIARLLVLFPSQSASYSRGLSAPFIPSICVGFTSFIGVCLCIMHTYNQGWEYQNTVTCVYLLNVCFNYFLFVQIAKKWTKFAYDWEELEKRIRMFDYPSDTAKMIAIISLVITGFSLIDYLGAVILFAVDAAICAKSKGLNFVKVYFVKALGKAFAIVDNPVSGIVCFTISVIVYCARNFSDMFIIVMSVALTDRYRQLNGILKLVRGKAMPAIFWKNVRQTYNYLSLQTKMLDHLLSPIIIVSFASNLYLICMQLLNSLTPMDGFWHVIYFVYSFTYLLLRTCAVSLYAAAIFEESKKPKLALFSVPSKSYCVEVARLLAQITSDDLALTGCQFFHITRTLVLTIAGTIVTYEIVLVQFNAVSGNSKEHHANTCL